MRGERCPRCGAQMGILKPHKGGKPGENIRTCSNFACAAQYEYVDGRRGPRNPVPVRPSRLRK